MNQTGQPDATESLEVKTVFRAIKTRTGRRGIRLEETYWQALERISKQTGRSLATLISDIEGSDINPKNLTSALRVYCLNQLVSEVQHFHEQTDEQAIRNLLLACPSPAISLLTSRRLQAFNRPFVEYVSNAFSVSDITQITSKLQLVLDQPVEQIEEELATNGNRPINVGIVLGLENRRIRGRINTISMPNGANQVLIGFVLN